MTKYMGDLLQKMIEYYGGGQSPIGPGFLTTGNQIDIENVNKQWAYCDRLSLHMYQVYLNIPNMSNIVVRPTQFQKYAE